MFKEQSEQNRREQNNDSVATGLLVRLIQFRFVAACLIPKKCFSLSTHASEYLQREDMDLTSGVAAIHDLKATMASFGSDQQFEMFLAEVNSFAEKCTCGSEVVDGSFSDSDPTALQNTRCRTLPAYLADGENVIDIPTLRCNRPECESEEQRFRREFYCSFLDNILNELNKRFSEKACEMVTLAATFHPRNLNDENASEVEKIAQFYQLSSDRVGQQFLLFSCNPINVRTGRLPMSKGPKTKCRPWICLPSLLEVFSKDDLDRLYPDLFKVIKIVATLPVTVASCERTHSKVKITNNYLRASMSPDILEDVVQISSERDIANNIDLCKLVEMFKLEKPRKLPL